MTESVGENNSNAYYSKKKLAIKRQNLAVFEILGGSYCKSNVSSGAQTFAANLIFIW